MPGGCEGTGKKTPNGVQPNQCFYLAAFISGFTIPCFFSAASFFRRFSSVGLPLICASYSSVIAFQSSSQSVK